MSGETPFYHSERAQSKCPRLNPCSSDRRETREVCFPMFTNIQSTTPQAGPMDIFNNSVNPILAPAMRASSDQPQQLLPAFRDDGSVSMFSTKTEIAQCIQSYSPRSQKIYNIIASSSPAMTRKHKRVLEASTDILSSSDTSNAYNPLHESPCPLSLWSYDSEQSKDCMPALPALPSRKIQPREFDQQMPLSFTTRSLFSACPADIWTDHGSAFAKGAPTSVDAPWQMLPPVPISSRLNINNHDLSKITQKWTDQELQAGRRLPQFRRRQSRAIVTLDFKIVMTADCTFDSICVSCVFWQEKGECYITSVDALLLSEILLGVRFHGKDKNRIRRRMDEFRPVTVSKTKPECEAFFKLLIGYSDPTPMKIKKDTKVFSWHSLGGMVQKLIVSHYESYPNA